MSFPSPQMHAIGWQVYRAVRFVSDWTRDGKHRDRVEYKAPCADPRCGGAVFTATTSKTCWRGGKLNRRCRKHSHPGDKVDNAKPPVAFSCIPLEFRPKGALVPKSVSVKARRRVRPARGRKERVKQPAMPPASPGAVNAAPRPSFLD